MNGPSFYFTQAELVGAGMERIRTTLPSSTAALPHLTERNTPS
jgi:hypothetical protein